MKEKLKKIPIIDDRPISYEQAKCLAEDLRQRDDDMHKDIVDTAREDNK